jgi:feruloyl esterase
MNEEAYMRHPFEPALFIFLLACIALVSIPAEAQQPCESLASIQIPNVTITSAKDMNPQWEIPATGGMFGTPGGQKVSVAFCRVEAFSAPTIDSHIGFEVWLPKAASWNGRFLAVGNPGFFGAIARGAMAGIVQKGYVAASTDTGHTDDGYTWAQRHPEKLVDWGHRAVHETAAATKQIIKGYYGKPVQYSYWNSCHNGGNQGLNEAQRYPEDFNGIVAGDPAYHVSRLQAGSLYIGWVSLKDGVKAPGYIPPAKYPVLNRAALDACDGKDGLVDGIIEDPPRCGFDPKSIQCPGNSDEATCLTGPQVETARKIYAGAKFNDGTQAYSGYEPGSELGWAMMAGGPDPLSINAEYFKGMVFENPNWDFRTFDVDRDTRLAGKRTGEAVDGFNPNLKPYKKNGGKLIIYQSWNETAVPPRTITDYYRSIETAMGGPAQTRDFARLFMAAGDGMCPGFGNAEDFNTLKAVEDWVEKDVAPDKIILTHREQAKFGEQGKTLRTRPVCAYPKVAKYDGSGDVNDAANFSCVAPSK